MNVTGKIMCALAMTLLLGCKPTNEKVPRAQESLNSQRGTVRSAETTNDRDTAQQKLSKELSDLDAKIAELKTRAHSAGERAKAEWEAQRPRLEAQRDAAAIKLDELKASSKEAWDQTRVKTEAAFVELQKGFKEAWAKLKE